MNKRTTLETEGLSAIDLQALRNASWSNR